jgi:hypothetical protein
VAHALGAQALDDPLRVGPQLVRHDDHAGEPAVDTHEHVRFARPAPNRQQRGGDGVAVVSLGHQERAAAHRHPGPGAREP